MTSSGVPPAAGTHCRGVLCAGAKMMVPSAAQLPPLPLAVWQMVITGPPLISTRRKALPAKKATERLSADQKGYTAPSLLGTTLASR